MRGRQRALRSHDALRHGRLRRQVGPRNLPRRQPAKQTQGQRHPRIGGEHGMAGGEDEPQKVVVERVVGRGRKVLLINGRAQLRIAAQLLGLTLVDLRAPQPVDAAMLGGGHEPGARVVRDARLRPLLEGGEERILGDLLGHPDVPHDPREAGHQLRRLDPPDRLDRPVRVSNRHLRLAPPSPAAARAAPARGRPPRPGRSPEESPTPRTPGGSRSRPPRPRPWGRGSA